MAESQPTELTSAARVFASLAAHDPAALADHELFWTGHREYLQSNGYVLRKRYQPGWVASWTLKEDIMVLCEDCVTPRNPFIMDAVRISDGKVVIFKKVSRTTHPYELQISQAFSKEPWATHPHNHCVPILDTLPVPGEDDCTFIVLPLLRLFDSPPFQTVGEAVEAIRQLIEGVQFIHQCHIAHRDLSHLNFMVDGSHLYRRGFHPLDQNMRSDCRGFAKPSFTRTSRPARYYIIDFGLSRQYDAENVSPREPPVFGGDRTVPEFQNSIEPCDPFPTDIYYIGSLIRRTFLDTSSSFGFLVSLVEDMVSDDPTKRPKIVDVVSRFETLYRDLDWRKLRSRVVDTKETSSQKFFRSIGHAFKTIGYIVARRPAIPTPAMATL